MESVTVFRRTSKTLASYSFMNFHITLKKSCGNIAEELKVAGIIEEVSDQLTSVLRTHERQEYMSEGRLVLDYCLTRNHIKSLQPMMLIENI